MRFRTSIDLLRAFEVFVAVAESGSMTKAAQSLHITQSAISQQLKQLETELGAALVDRSRRPLGLTPAGIALFAQAGDLLAQAERMRAALRQAAAGPLTQLRIAVFSTLAGTLVPALLKEIIGGKLATSSVSVMRGVTAYSGRELMQREVDVVITSNALYDHEGLERYDLIHERFIVAVPRAASTGDVTLSGLAARFPLIRYSQRTEAGRLIETYFRRQRLKLPRPYAFDSPEDLFTMVGMGHGWAVTTPTHAVHALRVDGDVRLLPLPGPSLNRSITLISRVGELGNLPRRLADLSRRTLTTDYLPRVRKLMPNLTDYLTVDDTPSDV